MLAQPAVLRGAGIAAVISTLLCTPRLLLWPKPPYPLWFFEWLLLLGGAVLWAFVFAWYPQYTGRPAMTLRLKPGAFWAATLSGVTLALGLHWLADPAWRKALPGDFPQNVKQWGAALLFRLGFTELFLVFAPFSWLLRLSRGSTLAVPLTVAFGAFVMLARDRQVGGALPPHVLAELLAYRMVESLVSVYFFVRGGAVAVWWWCGLLQSRFLLTLAQGG
jgi:hypothetical protein